MSISADTQARVEVEADVDGDNEVDNATDAPMIDKDATNKENS